MSELNTVIPSSGFSGVEKETPIQEPVKNNVIITPTPQVNADSKEEAEKTPQLTKREVSETVEEMNRFLQNMQRNLSFTVDEQSGESIILVKDSESDEIIRQIPSEELVVLRKKIDDVVGILFDTKV